MFGKYKHSITNTLVENYANKENFKKSFKGVMSPLKENKTAREFFVLYGEIENKRFDDKKLAESYLDEVISVLKSKKKNLTIPVISEGLGDKVETPHAGTPSTKEAVEGKYYQNQTNKITYLFKNGKYTDVKDVKDVQKSSKDTFVNKTANYTRVNYTFEDLKSGKSTAKLGDRGNAIKELQTLVGAKADGFFGPLTLTKVEKYQKSKGVPVTGIVDKKTVQSGTVSQKEGDSAENPHSGTPSTKEAVKGKYYQNQTNKITYLFDGKKYTDISKIQSESYNKIYSQLDSLIFNDAVRSIEKNLRNKRSLIEHLTRKESTKQTNKTVPMSLLSHLLTRKFNEKYSSLSEEDKTKLRKLSSLDKNELEDKVIKLKESTLSKLNSLKESSEDKDMKNKIQEVCESLDNSGVNISSILKMEKLNKSLIK